MMFKLAVRELGADGEDKKNVRGNEISEDSRKNMRINAYGRMGHCHLRNERYDGAIKAFKHALETSYFARTRTQN